MTRAYTMLQIWLAYDRGESPGTKDSVSSETLTETEKSFIHSVSWSLTQCFISCHVSICSTRPPILGRPHYSVIPHIAPSQCPKSSLLLSPPPSSRSSVVPPIFPSEVLEESIAPSMDLIAHSRPFLLHVHLLLYEECDLGRLGQDSLPHRHNSSTRHS